jgi:PII-like signaling protein
VTQTSEKVEAEQVLCRFHLTSFLHHQGAPLSGWIVHTAHQQKMQGATVLRGIFGLRADGTILAEKKWSISQELPEIVEVVDGVASLTRLLAAVEPHFSEGTITLERAHVVLYRPRTQRVPLSPDVDVVATRDRSLAAEVKTMKLPEHGVLLRIFIGASDRTPDGRPLYEAIVLRAREAHLAGATVLKGPVGFGQHSRLHTANLLELSTDLPIVIEIVDAEEKIDAFLPTVDELITEGLVTLEAVRILKYAATAR